MKKSYVKPVMESEAFVANEYVGACHYVKCKNCDSGFVYKTDPLDDFNLYAFSEDNDNFDLISRVQVPYFAPYTGWFYNGSELSCDDTEQVLTENGRISAHPVTITEINKNNNEEFNCGPNAS